MDLYFGVHDFYEFLRLQIPEYCTLEAYVENDIGRRSYGSPGGYIGRIFEMVYCICIAFIA